MAMLEGSLLTGITLAATAAMRAAPLRTDGERDPWEEGAPEIVRIHYGLVLTFFGWLALFGIPIFAASAAFAKPAGEWSECRSILFLLGLFIPMGAATLWEYRRYLLTATEAGLDCRSAWRRRRFLPWSEIQELSYSQASYWFILRARDGWKFRMSIYVENPSLLLAILERHLTPEQLLPALNGYAAVCKPFPWPREIGGSPRQETDEKSTASDD